MSKVKVIKSNRRLKAFIFQVGLIGNGFTIYILCSSKKLRTQIINRFLVNQSAIDFTTSFFLLITCNERWVIRIDFTCNERWVTRIDFTCNERWMIPIDFTCNERWVIPIDFTCNGRWVIL